METEKITFYDKLRNHAATVLNGIFTVFALLYAVMEGLGWELVPFSYLLVWLVLTAAVGLFFFLARKPTGYTSQIKTISCNIMPLTGALFGLWAVSFFGERTGMGALLAALAVIAAMSIGFGQGEKQGLSSICRIIGGVVTVLILVTLGLTTLTSGFESAMSSSEAISPEGTYTASVTSADLGATGADTAVGVRREKRIIPTPLGWICDVDEAVVYVGQYNPELTISWKDDDTLLIGQSETEMSEYFS